MADRPQRPRLSSERSRVVSRPVSREKAEKIEERRQRRMDAKKQARSSAPPVSPPAAQPEAKPVESRRQPAERTQPPARRPSRPAHAPDRPANAPRPRPSRAPAAVDPAPRNAAPPTPAREERDEPAKPEYRVIRGGAGRRRKGLIILTSVIVLLLASVVLINALSPAGLIELIETTAAGFGTGEGFPQDIGSTTDQSIAIVGGNIAVLTDTSLLMYKNDGYQIFSRQHGFSSPVLSASTSRVLVYDRGGTKLRVENAARSLNEMTFDHPIITASLGYDGTFVVATRSSEHLCDVTVYNADFEQVYVWHSASRYVTSVSMSDGGRYFAVGLLSVEAGEYVSHLLYFDRNSTEPVYTQEYRGSTLLSVDCKPGDRVVAVFDDMLSSVGRNGQRTDYAFDGQTLQAFDNHDNAGVAVSLTRYNQPQNAELLLFDATLQSHGGGQTEGIVQSVSMSGKRVCVLLREGMTVFDHQGTMLGTLEVDSDSLLVANTNSRATVVGAATVAQYDIGHVAGSPSSSSSAPQEG